MSDRIMDGREMDVKNDDNGCGVRKMKAGGKRFN